MPSYYLNNFPDNNAKVISSKRGLEFSRVAREYALHKSFEDVDICGVFNTFKVKVLYLSFFRHERFFATQGWTLDK